MDFPSRGRCYEFNNESQILSAYYEPGSRDKHKGLRAGIKRRSSSPVRGECFSCGRVCLSVGSLCSSCLSIERNSNASGDTGYGIARSPFPVPPPKSSASQAERARWLDYVDLEPKRDTGEKPLGPRGEMYKSLIGMGNSPTTLMGGGLEILQGRVTFFKAAKDIVESTLVPQDEPQQARREPRSSRAAHLKTAGSRPPTAAAEVGDSANNTLKRGFVLGRGSVVSPGPLPPKRGRLFSVPRVGEMKTKCQCVCLLCLR